ncbi:hypothetical protein FKM82_029950 [Ascaphus truei]
MPLQFWLPPLALCTQEVCGGRLCRGLRYLPLPIQANLFSTQHPKGRARDSNTPGPAPWVHSEAVSQRGADTQWAECITCRETPPCVT